MEKKLFRIIVSNKKCELTALMLLVGIFFSLNIYAAIRPTTCPTPQSIYKIYNRNHSTVMPQGWRSQTPVNLKNLPTNIRFVRATLYKNTVLCEYKINHGTIAFALQKAFKPYGSHWHSAGYSVSDKNFEIFECGHAYRLNYGVNYCEFQPTKNAKAKNAAQPNQ